MHMSERCLTDVFVELLKTKKHVRAFDRTISFGHWLSKTQKLAWAFRAFLLKKASTTS